MEIRGDDKIDRVLGIYSKLMNGSIINKAEALIQLVYCMNRESNLGSLLVKSVLHILYEFFFETFVIHFLISFLFALALDRHPLPG